MAWRIEEAVVRGEIDSRGRGRVTGRIWFAGRGTGGARSDTVGPLNRGQEVMLTEGAVLAACTVPGRHHVRRLFGLCAGLIIPAICFGEDAPVSAAPNPTPDAPW